jgi:nucleotide-binding universal stress UspA family protein
MEAIKERVTSEGGESACKSPPVHTILVPLDGSELSEQALPFAVALARQHGGGLLLLEATDEQHPSAEVDAYLSRWADRLKDDCGVAVVRDVAVGDAGRAIVDEAERHKADLIVMATHARTGVERALKGSVADFVLHHAAAPVLLVPAACDRSWVR